MSVQSGAVREAPVETLREARLVLIRGVAAIDALIAAIEPPLATGIHVPQPVIVAPAADQRSTARMQGFTGDCCSTCAGFAMRRSGTCLCCDACGSTTGCS